MNVKLALIIIAIIFLVLLALPRVVGAQEENDTNEIAVNSSIIDPGVTAVSLQKTDKPPGFEAVFAIAGLLAVAFLVLRQRK